MNESKSNAPKGQYFCGHCSAFRKATKEGKCTDCQKPIWELLKGKEPIVQDPVELEKIHKALRAIALGGKTSRGQAKKCGIGKKNPLQAMLDLSPYE